MYNSSNYISQLKLLFLSPTNFFKSVEKEKDYKTPLVFFFILNTIVVLIGFLLAFPFLNVTPPNYPENLTPFIIPLKILFTIFRIFFALLVPFIVSGFVHLGVLLLNGKNGFYNTFKPITYALSLGLIYKFAATIISGLFSFVYSDKILQLTALHAAPSPDPSAILSIMLTMLPMYALLFITGIAGFIHSFYAEIIGLAKFQKFTNLRAFFAIILIPILLSAMFIIILIILGVGIAAIASKNIAGAAISSPF